MCIELHSNCSHLIEHLATNTYVHTKTSAVEPEIRCIVWMAGINIFPTGLVDKNNLKQVLQMCERSMLSFSILQMRVDKVLLKLLSYKIV